MANFGHWFMYGDSISSPEFWTSRAIQPGAQSAPQVYDSSGGRWCSLDSTHPYDSICGEYIAKPFNGIYSVLFEFRQTSNNASTIIGSTSDQIEDRSSFDIFAATQRSFSEAQVNMKQAADRMKSTTDRQRRDVVFATGAWVLLSTKHLKPEGSAKLQHRFID